MERRKESQESLSLAGKDDGVGRAKATPKGENNWEYLVGLAHVSGWREISEKDKSGE